MNKSNTMLKNKETNGHLNCSSRCSFVQFLVFSHSCPLYLSSGQRCDYLEVAGSIYKKYFVAKVANFFSFSENLMDFNEARLHEVTLDPHTHS